MYAYALSGCLLFHVPCWLSLLWKSMYQNWFCRRFFLSLYNCSTLSINLSTASTIYKMLFPKGIYSLQMHSLHFLWKSKASHSGFFFILVWFFSLLYLKSKGSSGMSMIWRKAISHLRSILCAVLSIKFNSISEFFLYF